MTRRKHRPACRSASLACASIFPTVLPALPQPGSGQSANAGLPVLRSYGPHLCLKLIRCLVAVCHHFPDEDGMIRTRFWSPSADHSGSGACKVPVRRVGCRKTQRTCHAQGRAAMRAACCGGAQYLLLAGWELAGLGYDLTRSDYACSTSLFIKLPLVQLGGGRGD